MTQEKKTNAELMLVHTLSFSKWYKEIKAQEYGESGLLLIAGLESRGLLL